VRPKIVFPLTGRTEKNLQECAAEIKARGGHPITVQMDHGLDSGEGVRFSTILFRPSDLYLIDLHNFLFFIFKCCFVCISWLFFFRSLASCPFFLASVLVLVAL
jgi:hypothetical protein